jgi:hypothetical protein
LPFGRVAAARALGRDRRRFGGGAARELAVDDLAFALRISPVVHCLRGLPAIGRFTVRRILDLDRRGASGGRCALRLRGICLLGAQSLRG